MGNSRQLWRTVRKCCLFDFSDLSNGRNAPASSIKNYLSSQFCFALGGDTPYSKRLYDAIVGGCIPILLETRMVLPYSEILQWNKFSVRFNIDVQSDVDSIVPYLSSLSEEKVLQMQIELFRVRSYFTYPLEDKNFTSQPNDAVDGILQQLDNRQYYASTCDFVPIYPVG